jgi:drug/metabolite transporter (DMT)-like permease
MLAASLLFATMAVMVKSLGRIPTQEIVFFRSALNVAFTLALIHRYRVPVLGTNRLALLLRGGFGYAALSLHFYAIAYLPLADAVVIHHVSPLLVALTAPFVLGERSGPRVLFLSVLGVLGVGLILRPTGQVGLVPGLAALLGALMSTGAYLTIRGLGSREHPLTVVLYFPLVALAVSAIPTARGFVRPHAVEAWLLLGVGLTTTAAQICLTAALQRERAAVASTVSYTGLVFSVLLAAIFFDEIPGLRTIAGSAIVIGAALLVGRDSGPLRSGA